MARWTTPLDEGKAPPAERQEENTNACNICNTYMQCIYRERELDVHYVSRISYHTTNYHTTNYVIRLDYIIIEWHNILL